MSVAHLQTWRTLTCGDGCMPRLHDPADHDRAGYDDGYEDGYAQAVNDLRPRSVSVGRLSIDLVSKAVTVDDERVVLSLTEYRVLAFLAENVGRRCSFAEITAAIWGDISERRRGHNVRVTVSRMRARLGPAAEVIVSEYAFGYVLRHSQRDVFSLPVRGAST